MTAVERIVVRFKRAATEGAIMALEQVWSPRDTTADTRYRYRDSKGEIHTLFQNEVNGFLAGLGY